MKKTKLITSLVALTAAFALVMAGCNNDDDDEFKNTDSGNSSTIAGGEEPQAELEGAAFNVLRGLCALPTDATNSEEAGNGIEDLPEGWQGATYELDQALVPAPYDPEKTETKDNLGVYYIAATCADDAREFFSSLIDEDVSEDSYYWYKSGLGSLRFTVPSTAENDGAQLFATIDVELPELLPELRTIKFVPYSVLPEGTNKFSGTPYYHAGDIIMRNKDSSYWMCVRPASGPAKKDYSYWICLNPSVNGVVQTVEKSYTIDGQQKKGIYAKKLMSEKVAKATIHTLHMLSLAWWKGSGNGGPTASALTFKLIEVDKLAAKYNDADKTSPGFFRSYGTVREDSKSNQTFYVAYGSPKKDGKRTLKGNRADTSFNIVQPIMLASIKADNETKIREYIDTHFYGGDKKTTTCYSLTDPYDSKYLNAHRLFFSQIPLSDVYDVRKFYQKCDEDATSIGWKNASPTYNPVSDTGSGGAHVIISPELKIKDHGSAATGYTDVFTAKDLVGEEPTDYWNSLSSNNTQRYVNGKQVSMAKQISE